MKNFDIHYREKLLKRRKIGCIIMGFLSIFLLRNLGVLYNSYYNIQENDAIYIFAIPLVYTFLVEIFLEKAINDNLIPDKDFMHGIIIGFLFLSLKYVAIPYAYYYGTISKELLNNSIGYLIYLNVIPNIFYLICFLGWYYICDIRFKWSLKIRGEYDDIIEQHNREYEEYKKAQAEGRASNMNVKNENADLFDISGGFIKKISKKLEENIKK